MFSVLCWLCNQLAISRVQFDPRGSQFFLLSNFFVMDKERTMREPKARLYGAQPLVRVPKMQSYGTSHSLHDRAGTFASTYISKVKVLNV